MLFTRARIRTNKYRYTGFTHGVLHFPGRQRRRPTEAAVAAAISGLSQRRAVLVGAPALLPTVDDRDARSPFFAAKA